MTAQNRDFSDRHYLAKPVKREVGFEMIKKWVFNKEAS